MRRCRTCCMVDTRPDVPFDESGQCQACTNYQNRPAIDWDSRKAALLALLDRFDGRVIVPSSGGKDSTYIALRMKELGADVTAVTAMTCHLTPIGRANIDNLARHVRTIEVMPNASVRAKLNRLGLEMVGDASWPQHASIWSIPFKMAVALKNPLLMWGENSQDQYGGPVGSEAAQQMTRRWCSEFGGLNGLRSEDFVGLEGISKKDMADYTLPTDEEIQSCGVEGHFLGAYEPWDSRRNADVAMSAGMRAEIPCKANWWAFENLDCFITAWHDAGMYRKFGFGRGCAQISIDVRSGRISRDNAMEWIRIHDGLFPEVYAGVTTDEGLARIGITRKQLMDSLDQFTDWSLFDRVDGGRPILKEFA